MINYWESRICSHKLEDIAYFNNTIMRYKATEFMCGANTILKALIGHYKSFQCR